MLERFFTVLTYFIIYSFLGWVMESIVRSFCEKKIINTGFLIGPFCPIYGIGAISMLIFLDNFQNRIIELFFIALILLTSWEYIVGVALEKIFNTKYWDYSDHKFNFQGRICLTNSICWGVLGVIIVKYVHPYIRALILKIDANLLHYVVIIIAIVFVLDTIISIIKVKNIKLTLERIEELNLEIKEKLKEITKLTKKKEKSIEEKTTLESIKKIVEKTKKKRNRVIKHLYRNVHRLKKAFPAINTKEITQILNQKLDDIKNKKNT